MLDIIGWIGGICFAACAIPQAYKCWKQKHAHGISYLMLTLWTIGEVLTLAYVLLSDSFGFRESLPLILNYGANLLGLVIIIRYRVFPNAEEKK